MLNQNRKLLGLHQKYILIMKTTISNP